MQCFAYCRVSSEEQASDNHYPLDNQEQKAREYAKLKGWRIIEVRKDVASGKNASRDGYSDLLSAIGRGRVDCVVVYRLDRLSRNVRDIYDFLDLIARHQVAFVSLSEGFDTTTAMGRAMLGVAAVFAQLTREMIAENVKDGLMRRAQVGLYVGNHSGPYGYDYSSELSTLVVNPEHAEVVRSILDLFANRKWGLEKITKYLNAQNIPTRGGKQWTAYTIGEIVRNPTYTGKIRWHGQVFEGQHKPIVDEETFSLAQSLIEDRRPLPSRTHQSQHLLSGIAECGQCGKRLTAHYGHKRKDGTRHIFYTHRVRQRRDECQAFFKSAAKLERLVVDEIGKIATSGVLEQMATEELQKGLKKTTAPLAERRQSIVSSLSTLTGRFNSWADRLDRGLIDEEQFGTQNLRLLKEKTDLQKELAALDVRLSEYECTEVTIEAAQAALKRFPDVWESLEIEERRELLRQLIERLQVYRDRVILKLVLTDEQEHPV